MIRRVVHVGCDLCGRMGVDGRDELDACRRARAAGWREVRFDTYGNNGHVCPGCAAGRTDAELLALILGEG